MEDFNFNISVVGLGVIGGSIAYALRNTSAQNIWGIDNDRNTLAEAKKNQMIDQGFELPKQPLSKSDIVILSIYPKDCITFIARNMNAFKSGCIILDTSGIKRSIVSEIESIIRDDIDFIGGHPMAGNEGKGVHCANKSLFKNANFLLTPSHNNREKNILTIETLLKAMGFGKISKISPEKHDEMIGYTSQLPHIIAASLINCNDNMDITRFTGNSFDEFTRIAKMNAPLWAQLIMGNRDNIIPLMDAFISELIRIKDTLSDEDMSQLESIFRSCTIKKKEMR